MDTSFAERLLYMGIVVVIAGIVGGGLDAAGVIKFPTLRSWKVQAAVAFIGVATMAWALVSLQKTHQEAAIAAKRLDWQNRMFALAGYAVGVPPPQWPGQRVRFELVDLVVTAGDDADENCKVAAFVAEYSDRLDQIPTEVVDRMREPAQASAGHHCYAEAERAAEIIRTRRSGGKNSSDRPLAAPVGDVVNRPTLLAATGWNAVLVAFDSLAASDSRALAQMDSATKILESLTAPGDEGYLYLGTIGPHGLGTDRTVVEDSVRPNSVATIRLHVNLRKLGDNMDVKAHDVFRVLTPGTKVSVERLVASKDRFRWARVRVISLPRKALDS